MRTNIELDDKLIKEAFRYADVKTKKALVDLALEEFVNNKRRMDLGEIRGKIRFSAGYDYKKMRRSA